ncbi:hypothetical protein CBL_20834 [Carabus blaptoides fortunei]
MTDDGKQQDDSSRVLASIRKLGSDDQWETGDAEPSEAYRRWQRDNARAARIIGTSLEEGAAMHVRKKTDAKVIWDYFEISKNDATTVTKHTSRLANVFDDILQELRKNNKVGHLISKCRKRAGVEQKGSNLNDKNSDSSLKQDSKPCTFIATGLTVNSDSVSADSWISDSDATHHMTANKQYFVTFEKFPIPQRIQTTGNECIFAYGSGSINVDVFTGNEWSSASLNDVWYIPEARHQLFSIRGLLNMEMKLYLILTNFRSKFDDKVVFGYFIGYVNEKDGYKVWVPSRHRVKKSRNVDFRPEKLCTTSNTIELEFQHSSREVGHNDETDHVSEEDSVEANDARPGKSSDNSEVGQTTRPVRRIRQPAKLNDYEGKTPSNEECQNIQETVLMHRTVPQIKCWVNNFIRKNRNIHSSMAM